MATRRDRNAYECGSRPIVQNKSVSIDVAANKSILTDDQYMPNIAPYKHKLPRVIL